MDNQQDQLGANAPTNANAGRNSQNSNDASNAAPSSRKSAPAPSAQSTDATPNASAQNTAGAERQAEGQQTNDQEGTLLDTALNSGKKWIEDSGVLNSVNQLPQNIKDLGNRALDKVNGLSTTQKVVGGAILAAGIGWLAARKVRSSSSDDSSESSPYNYGRQRDAGSYGRRSYGYQAPDASTSRRTASGAANRSDSGAPYGNSTGRYGSSSAGYLSDSSAAGSNTGIQSGSGRFESGSTHASARTDHGQRSKDDGFRSIE